MCLDTVDAEIRFKKSEVVLAWKGFHKLYGDLITPSRNFPCPQGKWIKDPETYLINYTYPTGFHVCATREGAIAWGPIIRKVLVKGIHTTGHQYGDKIYVAKYLYVPKDNEKIVGNKKTGYKIAKRGKK